MSDRFFLDTNILVYAFSGQDPVKRTRAMALLRRAIDDRIGVISWQVVQEFLQVAIQKNTLSVDVATLTDTIRMVLTPLCRVFPTTELWESAVRIHQQSKYRFYDSLIVAAAISSGATRLFTEDMQHGHTIGALRIENPFAD